MKARSEFGEGSRALAKEKMGLFGLPSESLSLIFGNDYLLQYTAFPEDESHSPDR